MYVLSSLWDDPYKSTLAANRKESFFWGSQCSTTGVTKTVVCVILYAYKRTITGNRKESYFSFKPYIHDWCNKGRRMYYPVCGMMHIKEA